ncbi:MAG TPA: hypothetical protein VFS43_29470 [Polyangiaceae bacterium]|nr:hypothetical protein [Polyangiaceae bacterium]
MADELERLLAALYPELRERAGKAATYVFRLVGHGEPVGRLLAELVRASAPTLPPGPADETPVPPTVPTGPKRPA